MAAGLATGYTYIPGRRGGVLLSALPTIVIVVSASALFLAAIMTVIDHYDRRPNEAFYANLRKASLKAALYLFIAAPFVELGVGLLFVNGIDVSRHFHGFAENYTFADASFRPFAQRLEAAFSRIWLLFLLAAVAGWIGVMLSKRPSVSRRLVALLLATSLLGVSVFGLGISTRDFLLGEVKAGYRSGQTIVRAAQEPAKFNAILLAKLALSGMIFTGSCFVIIAAAAGRLKPPPAGRK